ncbi:hypothetical protein [Desulfuribacillus alkaliarsenatis]|uniref:hypothetical protein n=1 Tax=Desulfuribacillus alkaliarsenatis TaxID=766136 RepID=UPI0015B3BCDF|nr:hypothetical protein [Desulfuribacillus alkaliarsenatis]
MTVSKNYKTLDLDPLLLSKIHALESEIRTTTNKEVLLLAYEDTYISKRRT